MTPYKQALCDAMALLAKDPAIIFIGYGLKKGRAAGTIPSVPDSMLIETPVAENLMAGMATGLSLAGRKPLVFFERFDFALNAADAIVNHLDKARQISRGEFNPGIIFRCVVGNCDRPLYTGITHTRNHAQAFREMVGFPVVELERAEQIAPHYIAAHEALSAPGAILRSTMLVEFKSMI
jgi:pyruvate/2-oxoglutarate/acetoin dehydrogenase E1 component